MQSSTKDMSLMDKLLKKLDHDDNNQNHYNEDTTYEYKHTATGKDEDYKVDKDPEDKHEEDASLTEKIKDKFTNNDDDKK